MHRPRDLATAALLALLAAGGCAAASSPGAAGAAPPPAAATHGLRLPATFRGDLPCADCEAIRHHLDLWPDQVFHLRREWVGRDLVRDEIGRWRIDPSRRALVLENGGEGPLQLEIEGPDALRLLDLEGRPIVSELPYELSSDGTLTPTDLSLLLAGEMQYVADAARFHECRTGRSYPMVMEEDFVAAERAYRDAVRTPGARLYVSFEGSIVPRPTMDGEGLEPTVVVHRFVSAWPEQSCERGRADASLTGTYWRLVRLGGDPVRAAEDRREPHLLLRGDDDGPRYSATVGCNQLLGGYDVDGEAIRFQPAATTLMACPPPLDALERALASALAAAARWRIEGSTLELLDREGGSAALLEAMYF